MLFGIIELGLLLIPISSAADTSSYQTWCGKYYQNGAPTTPPPASAFYPIPITSHTPLLDFSCSPAIRPYIDGDTTASILIDARLSYQVGVALKGGTTGNLSVSVSVGRQVIAASIPVNSTSNSVPFDLTKLTPQAAPIVISCQANDTSGNTYTSTGHLSYLPKNPYGGSIVKTDLRTGGLLVPDSKGSFSPFFPLGFYTSFDGNLSALDEQKSMGVNVVHPIPPFDDSTLAESLDRIEDLGMWLMYDMRHTYTNSASVESQVNEIKSRKNLLLWYTADEPDGTNDADNATTIAYDLINSLDCYHPVSLVLNCEDYKWSTYTAGSDIIMTDPYPLYLNTTFSKRYETICNETFGCCGCDNCHSGLADVSSRLDTFYQRREWEGRRRNATVWAVLQAFDGTDEFWTGTPTGNEYLAMALLSISHGAMGIVSWMAPTTSAILRANKVLGASLPVFNSYILDPSSSFSRLTSNTTSLDVGLWTQASSSLLIVINLLNATLHASSALPLRPSKFTSVLDSDTAQLDSKMEVVELTLEPFGVGGWTFTHAETVSPATSGVPAVVTAKSMGSRRLKMPWEGDL